MKSDGSIPAPKASFAPANFSAHTSPSDSIQGTAIWCISLAEKLFLITRILFYCLIEFLTFSRTLFRPTGSNVSSVPQPEIPLESDAAALEYFSDHGYDMKRTSFDLLSSMSCGKGEEMV